MFTGIVETTGEVVGVDDTAEGRRLRVRASGLDDLHHGQSISVSGVCLTVESFGDADDPATASGESDGEEDDGERTSGDRGSGEVTSDEERDDGSAAAWFEVFLAAETVEKTYLGDVTAGDRVNVERALRADGRFDGHVVQGHVDTTTEVTAVERVGEDWRFTFALPEGFGRYVVDKGSVALDGISLTVAAVDREAGAFSVAIIPTTYELTTLSEKAAGDPVHVEVDVVAKYVENMLEGYRDRR